MILRGLDMVLFRGDAGTQGSTEMKNVKDLTLDDGVNEIDVTTRKSAGWRQFIDGLRDASISFDMLYDTEDADLKFISDAYNNRTAVSIFCSDGLGSGVDADWRIFSFNRSESLEEAVTVSVTLKPASTRTPTFVEATAG